MIKPKQEWYVFYTFPRAEKVVCEELQQRQYKSFLPLYKTISIWKNRQKKTIYKVLFPGYIFVKISDVEICRVLQIPKICTCIKCGSKPSIIRESDIEAIRLILSLGNEISIGCDFIAGDHVRIKEGALAGHEGILIRKNGKYRFSVQLKEINKVVTADIHASMVEKIDIVYNSPRSQAYIE